MSILEVGKNYRVLKGSSDGTFEEGDRIYLTETGDIVCKEAGGWIDVENVTEATIGLEVEIDAAWAEWRRRELLKELAAIR